MTLFLNSGKSVYSSPYRLSGYTDGMLAGTGAALNGLSFYTGNDVSPLSDQEVTSLSKNDINRFDRSAASNWSPSAGKWSNVTLAPVMLSPAGFIFGDETGNDIITIGVMYAESILVTQGLNGSVKHIVHRNRPYTYNPDAPDTKKKSDDAVLSFYSGHTAHAFNSAVFAGTVFSDYYPENSWKYAVWGASLATASLTGYLRYRAGMHYPSDIIAGAVAGSATGWLIPSLHKTERVSISVLLVPGKGSIAALVINY